LSTPSQFPKRRSGAGQMEIIWRFGRRLAVWCDKQKERGRVLVSSAFFQLSRNARLSSSPKIQQHTVLLGKGEEGKETMCLRRTKVHYRASVVQGK